ncbi:MAG: N-acetylmuramic acid 6-phosphate etherase [Planctomycetota bacterium]
MTREVPNRGHLATEGSNPASAALDTLATLDAVDLMRAEDARVITALEGARVELAQLVDLAAERLARGGRLFYVGAGTSGRLGVLDASECPPTFGVPKTLVQGVIAGGEVALTNAVEGAEDDREQGARDLVTRGVAATDCVVGIAAGGTTPYVHGALAAARGVGAATGFIACVPLDQVPDDADVSVRLLVGPEVLQGSTRMKAGTVTKLALNTLSTLAMVRLGKVHGNRMVDVDTKANIKLVDRGARLVQELGEVTRERALALLDDADGKVKVAVVMAKRGLDAAAARAALQGADGVLRRALSSGALGVEQGGDAR